MVKLTQTFHPPPKPIDYFSMYYYTNFVLLKVIRVSFNLKLCIFKVDYVKIIYVRAIFSAFSR